MRYDLDLFLKLNEEWADRPLVPQPRKLRDPNAMAVQAEKRVASLSRWFDLEGKRVLELGCGRGEVVRVLSRDYGCDAVGMDIVRYDEWGADQRFVQADVADPPDGIGGFDLIVSHALWEHVEHPYTALVNQRDMLAPDGRVYLYANLYRGAKASHRYREVFFPWPHLLFTDEVIREFYLREHGVDRAASWVNKLVFSQYVDHFERIGYGIERVWPSRGWWDEQFYTDHIEVLGRYPKWDLQHDFIHAVLTRDPHPAEETVPYEQLRHQADEARQRALDLQRRIEQVEASTSWRLTRPLRKVGDLIRRR